MKLWSRGLGKQQLQMDFMRYEITQDGDEIVISGRIVEPVTWDFWIRFNEDDIPGLIRVAKNRNLVRMVLRRYRKKLGRLFLFWRRQKPQESEEPEKAAAEAVASAAGSRNTTCDPE
jgi:hypothetical protein